ncbi:Uu.00g128960.m01.CDS01 [Anthostomella pinea]|uniref:Mitochondrial genome maintenance protein MGM101 n=1 Tax=Anthostomella pinea TaxID=933095 RepID=A0AAI8VIH2_9PEZI|nr:Uu.00g128960.m01.CDS01 [Anthostomella pinea]
MSFRTMTPLRAASRHTSTASKTATTSSSTPPPSSRTPAFASSKPARSKSTPTPTPAASRTPIPPVSGTPLPDAPSTTTTTPSPNSPNGENSTANPIDWANSYHGLGTSAFAPETAAILQAPLDADDIEVKPDGIIYLPEIKYRRILNAAFGPGGWGLAPRGELAVQDRLVTREYALVVHGRFVWPFPGPFCLFSPVSPPHTLDASLSPFVGQARGEQQYFSEDGVSTAAEGCKSNALMRCCKDLGIASELWDPRFIRRFMKQHAVQTWVEHVTTKKRKQIWLRKDDEVRYPFKKTS